LHICVGVTGETSLVWLTENPGKHAGGYIANYVDFMLARRIISMCAWQQTAPRVTMPMVSKVNGYMP
jgi:hypothetical protein